MGGEIYCGKEQRFKRSEQVAATRWWSVLLPQSSVDIGVVYPGPPLDKKRYQALYMSCT